MRTSLKNATMAHFNDLITLINQYIRGANELKDLLFLISPKTMSDIQKATALIMIWQNVVYSRYPEPAFLFLDTIQIVSTHAACFKREQSPGRYKCRYRIWATFKSRAKSQKCKYRSSFFIFLLQSYYMSKSDLQLHPVNCLC